MKKIWKKFLAMFLAAIIIVGIAPLDGLVEFELPDFNWFIPKAEAANIGVHFMPVETAGKMDTDGEGFTAQWEIKSVTITFKDGDKTLTTIKQDYGTAVTAPEDPTKEGYTFTGWDKNVPEIMPDADVTINATWEINKYDVIWNVDGVTTIIKDVPFGTAIEKIAAPEKTGYTFTGWTNYTDGMTMPANDVEFIAAFEAKEYTVTFDANDGAWDNGDTTRTVTAKYGETLVVPVAPGRTGYTFYTWSPSVPTTMPACDLKLYAYYIPEDEAPYFIEFYVMDNNGNYTILSQALGIGNIGTHITVTPETFEGLIFNSDKSVLEGIVTADGKATLKVYYDRVAVQTVTVSYMNSENIVIYSYTSSPGAKYNVPQLPTENGYICTGWSNGGIPGELIALPNEDTFVYPAFDLEKKYVEFVNSGKTGFTYLTFKQEWFENDSEFYNHSLGQLCSQFAMLGYDTKKKNENYDENKMDIGFKYTKPNLKTALETIGMADVEIAGYTLEDEVNTFIAHRKIRLNGEEYFLVFAGFIGSQDGQWYNNFDPGTDSTHKGFNSAKKYSYDLLENYIKRHGFEKSKTKILITGHSRGAATANLVAADLIKNEIYAEKENIFTYAFATPNSTSLDERKNVEYKRIFNIVNPEDFVTKVIPSKWGYGRYGTTYTLPSKTNTDSSTYTTYKAGMQQYFFNFTQGQTYDPYVLGEFDVYKAVSSLTSVVWNVHLFYLLPLSAGGAALITTYNFFQNTLCHFVSNIASALDYTEAAALILSTLTLPASQAYKNILKYFILYSSFTEEVEISGKFNDAHRMETYCAYMMSISEAQIKQYRKGYENTVNCPVDIEVYDNTTNELIGKITNNVIDEAVAAGENAIVMDVYGDSKSFWLPSNGNYRIVLTGNDEGTMDYSVSSIDSDTGETERINFFNVEIENGVSMEGDFTGEEFVLDEYTLTHEKSGTIKPTETLKGDELDDITISITTEGIGYADENITVTSGDYVTLTATTNEGNNFIGWYENDVLVSTEAEYSFVAKESRNLIAKFTNNYTIQWDVDGEITTTYSAPDTAIVLPESPEKERFKFIGWTPEVPEVMPAENLTFTAVFEELVSDVPATPDEPSVPPTEPSTTPVEVPTTTKPTETEPSTKPVEAPSATKPTETEPSTEPVEVPATTKPAEIEPSTNPVEVPTTTKPAETEPSTKPIVTVPVPSVEIRRPSQTEIKYGDSIILHADIDGDLPNGAKIVWTADNSNFTYTAFADGTTCTASPSANGDTVFTATVYDADGNEICSDTQTMTAKAGFFQKIIAFFKKIFGLTKVIPEAFKNF